MREIVEFPGTFFEEKVDNLYAVASESITVSLAAGNEDKTSRLRAKSSYLYGQLIQEINQLRIVMAQRGDPGSAQDMARISTKAEHNRALLRKIEQVGQE